MVNNWEKGVSILAGNLNSGLSYLITTVNKYVVVICNEHLGENIGFFEKEKLYV